MISLLGDKPKELKANLHYDPETGYFTWLRVNCNRIHIGNIAGSLNKNDGYIQISVNKNKVRAHRLAFLYMTGKFPGHEIDHINHIRHDNRLVNLREATDLDNSRNKYRSLKNTSGVIGVFWNKARGKWVAFIYINNKNLKLGSFFNKQEAINARKEAERIYGFHENHGLHQLKDPTGMSL